MSEKKAENYRVFFPSGANERGMFAIDKGKGTRRVYYDHIHIVGPICELCAFREKRGSLERVACLKVKGVLGAVYYRDGEELKVDCQTIVIQNPTKKIANLIPVDKRKRNAKLLKEVL